MFEVPTRYGKPETHRVKTRHEELCRTSPRVDSQRAVLFTEYMLEHDHEPLYLRTAGAFRHVLSHITPVIFDNELLVGNISRYLMGAQFYPEYDGHRNNPAKQDSLNAEKPATQTPLKGASNKCLVSREDRENIDKAAQLWLEKDLHFLSEELHLKTISTVGHTEKHLLDIATSSIFSYVPKDWLVISYPKILNQGADSLIENIREFIDKSLCETNPDSAKLREYLKGMIRLLQGIISFAQNYAHEAQRQASLCRDSKRGKELLEIARVCMKVPRKTPETFREALQSFWFVHVCMRLELPERNASPGRFDRYMNPFFEHDLLCGSLSVASALELLELMRIKCEEIITIYKDKQGRYLYRPVNQYITLAGSDKNDNAADTLLSKFMLQARINIHTEQPMLAVRWREDLSDFFKHKVIDCIKTARWCPDIYHDRPNTHCCSCKTLMPSEKLWDWIVYADNTKSSENLLESSSLLFKTLHTKIFDLLLKYIDFSPKEPTLVEDKNRNDKFQIMVGQYYTLIRQTALKKLPEPGNVILGSNNTGVVHPCLSTFNIFDPGFFETDPPVSFSYSNLDRISALSLIDLAKALTVLSTFLSKDALFTISEIREAIQTDFEGTETMRQKILGETSLSSQDPLFEETLVNLFDTWALFVDQWRKSISPGRSIPRRFSLIRGAAAKTQ